MWSKLLTVTAAVASLTPFVSAFDAEAKNNVAIYYGQGYDQKRLSHFCAETSLDIINLGFIDIFPDQGPAGWPGSDFGNQCDGTTYQVGSVSTDLLKGCYQLIEDIPICQAAGKKVLLSLGGSTPTNQQILSNSSAVNFADFLWGAFGPKTDEWVNNNGPRPFGDVVVDGFDFDIEHNGGFGYAVMINHFRQLFKQAPDQTFYISGAPQCQIPDKQLADAITNSVFDFIWVQFYNTDGCAAIDYDFVSDVSTGFNFDSWVSFINGGKSRNAKLYMGLPASASAANAGFYITPAEASILATKYMGLYPDTFGGMMVWEATASDENSVDGVSFAGAMKDILLELDPLPVTTSSSVAVASSTPVPSTTAVPSSVLTTSSSVVSSSTLSAVTSSTIVVPTSPVSASTVVAPSTPVLSSTSSATSSPVVVSSSVSVPAISLTTSVHSTTPVLSSLSIVSSSSVVASSPVVSIAPAITTSSISFSPSPVVASSSPVALSSSVSSSSPAVPSSSVVSSVSVASSAIATSGIPFSSSSSVVPVSPIASSSSVVSGSPPPSSPASSSMATGKTSSTPIISKTSPSATAPLGGSSGSSASSSIPTGSGKPSSSILRLSSTVSLPGSPIASSKPVTSGSSLIKTVSSSAGSGNSAPSGPSSFPVAGNSAPSNSGSTHTISSSSESAISKGSSATVSAISATTPCETITRVTVVAYTVTESGVPSVGYSTSTITETISGPAGSAPSGGVAPSSAATVTAVPTSTAAATTTPCETITRETVIAYTITVSGSPSVVRSTSTIVETVSTPTGSGAPGAPSGSETPSGAASVTVPTSSVAGGAATTTPCETITRETVIAYTITVSGSPSVVHSTSTIVETVSTPAGPGASGAPSGGEASSGTVIVTAVPTSSGGAAAVASTTPCETITRETVIAYTITESGSAPSVAYSTSTIIETISAPTGSSGESTSSVSTTPCETITRETVIAYTITESGSAPSVAYSTSTIVETVPAPAASATGSTASSKGNGSGPAPIGSAIMTGQTSVGSDAKAASTTTVIVTSYVDICPEGFTTITTTYTATYSPATATASVTNPVGVAAQATGPSVPEGWTTRVTVCTHCAATPTTVTLTLPATGLASVAASATKTPSIPEGWTTTVSVCTGCGPTPTTVTVTVPISAGTGAETLSAHASGAQPAGNSSGPEGAGAASALTAAATTATAVVPASHSFSSRPVIPGTGSARPSSTLHVQPSGSGSRVAATPSGTQVGVSPVFTGGASRGPELRIGAGAVAALALALLAAV